MRLEASEAGLYLLPDWADPHRQAAVVLNMCKFLRTRDSVFGSSLFSDPSWEIILLLHAARTESVPITITKLGSALPASVATLQHCLTMLVSQGLVVRKDNAPEAILDLSEKASALIEQSFSLTPVGAGPVWRGIPLEC